MRQIFTFLLLAVALAAGAYYAEIPGLSPAGKQAAEVFDNYDAKNDRLREALSSLRHAAGETFATNPADTYLLGVMYANESARYTRLFHVILDEYDTFVEASRVMNTNPEYSDADYMELVDPDGSLTEMYANALPYNPEEDIDPVLLSDFKSAGGYGMLTDSYPGYADAMAANYFYIAAANGHLPALNNLANMQLEGRGMERNPAMAIARLRQVSEAGLGSADAILGQLYYRGDDGVPQDYAKAVTYLTRAVDRGYGTDNVLLLLGYCHEKGLGTPLDVRKAVSIYERNNGSDALKNVFRGAVDDFSIPARLAILYYTDPAVKSFDKAFPYLKFMGELNTQVMSQVRGYLLRCLSACYRFGRGTAVDLDKADYYLRQAAETGNMEAAEALSALAPR